MFQQTISSTGLQLRKMLKGYQDNFTKATEISQTKYKHNQASYKHVSQTVNVIIQCTKNYNSEIQKKLTFLVGATGAGKSTLLNYLASDDSNFMIFNEDGAIKTLRKSVAEIGGVSATTLYPNMYECDLGVFLDCAGEGDTGGIIIEIINSIIKNQISIHVEESKILFVTPYSSLKAAGAYGHSFKMALDKNAQFMGDINYLKNNIGFIITGGITKKTAVKSAKQGLEYILTHADVGEYKDTMKQVIDNNYIAVFSKPSEDAEIGDTYSPPEWNPKQREVIIDMINQIPFGKIPSKDFFNVSSNPFVREIMSKALHIVVAKAGDYLGKAVVSKLPLDIYTVQIEPFSKYINQLAIGSQCDLATYVQILKWNNYFKLQLDDNLIAQLQRQINFLNSFCTMKNKDGEQDSNLVKRNWTIIANLQIIFNQIHSDLEQIIRQEGHNFVKFLTKKTVKTSSLVPENAQMIVNQIKELYQKERQLDEITKLGKMQQSKFYKSQIKKQHVGSTQQAYKQMEKYQDIQKYEEWRPAQHEFYTESQERSRKVYKPKTVTQQNQVEVVYDTIKKFDIQEKYQQQQKFSTFFKKVFTLGFGDSITQTKTRTKTIEVPTKQVKAKKIKVQKQIIEQKQQTYTENVQKIKTVREAGYQTKYRDVCKEQEVTKYKEKHHFKDLEVKELNEIQFEKEKTQCQNSIHHLRASIQAKITKYPKGPTQLPRLPPIKTKDEFEEKINDLLEKLRQAEYSAYLVLKSGQTLEIMGVNQILIELTSMKMPLKATDVNFQENPETNGMNSPLVKVQINFGQTCKVTQKGF